jgi:hypothetical protein
MVVYLYRVVSKAGEVSSRVTLPVEKLALFTPLSGGM